QLDAAFAGGADEADGEALVVRHGDNRRLTVARQPLDADALGVDDLVGLEIIQGAAGAPGPSSQRAPIVGLPRLALVAQADDAARQAGTVVGLTAVGDNDRVAPALGKDLLLPARPAAAARWGAEAAAAETEFHDHRHR